MGNLRPWAAVPYDRKMRPGTRQFLEWTRAATARLVGVLEPLPAVTLSVEGVAGAVVLEWDEIPNVGVYLCYEADNVGEIDMPFAVIRSKGTGRNGAVRSGSTDTDTRFYYVQAVSPLGVLGHLAGPIEGAAASAIDLTGMDEFILPTSLQLFREDFLSGGGNGNEGWLGCNHNLTAGQSYIAGPGFPYIGVSRIGTSTNNAEAGQGPSSPVVGANQIESMGTVWNQPGNQDSNGDFIEPFDSYEGWHLILIFRLPDGPTVTELNVGFVSSQGSFISCTGSQDCFALRWRPSVGQFQIVQHRGHSQALQDATAVHTLEWKDDGTAATIADSDWHRIDLISKNGPMQLLRHGPIYLHCYLDGREMRENFFGGTPWILGNGFTDTSTTDYKPLTRAMAPGYSMVNRFGSSHSINLDVDYFALQYTRAQPIVPELPRWCEVARTP